MKLPLPQFFTDPVLGPLGLDSDDPAFSGPSRLAREAAAATAGGDALALSAVLNRAWRSGALDDLLDSVQAGYGCAHEIGEEEAAAIGRAAKFVKASDRLASGDIELLDHVAETVEDQLVEALADENGESCMYPVCVAMAATQN